MSWTDHEAIAKAEAARAEAPENPFDKLMADVRVMLKNDTSPQAPFVLRFLEATLPMCNEAIESKCPVELGVRTAGIIDGTALMLDTLVTTLGPDIGHAAAQRLGMNLNHLYQRKKRG
jgi:hypothetical protein